MTLHAGPVEAEAATCPCGCHLHGSHAHLPGGAPRAGGVPAALSLPLVWAVVVYQRLVSPLTPATCRYYPSCSAYGIAALRRFGPFTGGWLVVRRLARCHPWAAGGVDHVPRRRTRAPSRLLPLVEAGTNRCLHCAPDDPRPTAAHIGDHAPQT